MPPLAEESCHANASEASNIGGCVEILHPSYQDPAGTDAQHAKRFGIETHDLGCRLVFDGSRSLAELSTTCRPQFFFSTAPCVRPVLSGQHWPSRGVESVTCSRSSCRCIAQTHSYDTCLHLVHDQQGLYRREAGRRIVRPDPFVFPVFFVRCVLIVQCSNCAVF